MAKFTQTIFVLLFAILLTSTPSLSVHAGNLLSNNKKVVDASRKHRTINVLNNLPSKMDATLYWISSSKIEDEICHMERIKYNDIASYPITKGYAKTAFHVMVITESPDNDEALICWTKVTSKKSGLLLLSSIIDNNDLHYISKDRLSQAPQLKWKPSNQG